MSSTPEFLYDVKISHLKRLDEFASDPQSLDEALGNRLDSCTDEDRVLRVCRTLFGQTVEETLSLLREGQPGFAYAERIKKIVEKRTESLSTTSHNSRKPNN